MGLLCIFGKHKWNGCKCSSCHITRDEGHDWSKDCEMCTLCGLAKKDSHKWEGCKCSTCGKTRDELHDWNKDCERCARCRTLRKDAHKWDGFKCSVCGKTRVDEYIEQLHEWDTLLGGMLLIIDMAKYGEGEALRPQARALKEKYMAIRALLTNIGSQEAKAALMEHGLSLKYLESSGMKL
jgi:hypothetical protein